MFKFENGEHVTANGKNMVYWKDYEGGGKGKVYCDYVDPETGDVCYDYLDARNLRPYKPKNVLKKR